MAKISFWEFGAIRSTPKSIRLAKKNEQASAPSELAGSPPKDLPPLSMKAQSIPHEASQKKSAAPNFVPALAPLEPALPAPASVLAESPDAPRRISPATAAVQETNPQSHTLAALIRLDALSLNL